MSHARLLIGDVFERMAGLEDGSVDLVLTSPPFLALRSYLPADHPDKAKEIGSEPAPAAFLDTLLALTAEWRRVLAPHGSIAVELGDTYSGSGGAGGDYAEGGLRDGQNAFAGSMTVSRRRDREPVPRNRRGEGDAGWPLAKSLCGIPHLYHLSLAYGRNLLTGEPSRAGQWRVRNVVAWCRPNPPVGALGDKFRPGTSYMTIATIARDRWFDLDAVRSPFVREDCPPEGWNSRGPKQRANGGVSDPTTGRASLPVRVNTHDGAPPLDWWEIPTQPYPGAHYATWPAALCERPIEAMCPRQVCTTCGEPRRRITERTSEYADHLAAKEGRTLAPVGERLNRIEGSRMSAEVLTVGWTDCGHDTWRNGIVLDPFAGSGTTLAVATGHGRDAIGIDLDERNADLAQQRVGMFLDTDLPGAVA